MTASAFVDASPAADAPFGGRVAAPEPSCRESGERRERWVAVALWVLALAGTVVAAYARYRMVLQHANPVDLSIFVRAARLVSQGRNPYLVRSPARGYVYTPILAIVLAPLSHLAPITVLRAWTAFSLACATAAAACVATVEGWQLRSWQRPVLFALCVGSAFSLWPVTTGLVLGQADLVTLAVLCAAVLARKKGRHGRCGTLVGVAGLIKVWPVLALASLLRRGATGRKKALVPLAGVSLVGPLLALVLGGGSGLGDMLRNIVEARSQRLISYSVWGMPKLWYSDSGLANSLDDSIVLQITVTLLLAAFVGWLLVSTLRRVSADSPLELWHCLGCVVLLLPVSHAYYTVYFLPLLWHWSARALRSAWRDPATLGVLGVLAVLVSWWLILVKVWPSDGPRSPWTSSLDIGVVFLANLLACTASIVGARYLERRLELSSSRQARVQAVVSGGARTP